MKKLLVVFLVFFTNTVYSENSIMAIVNNYPITFNSLKNKLEEVDSKDEQLIVIKNHIDHILQLQEVNKLNLAPLKNDVEIVLFDIAKSNNISINELINFDESSSIEREIIEKLSILNLQRFITKDLKISEKQVLKVCSNGNSINDQKQIKIAQIIISEVKNQANDLDKKNSLIETFLNKLKSHINKGASFESFAKLHSQHPSYHNGGITEWLSVKGPILEMIDSLKKNEISSIYMTDFGLAIAIKVDERFISSKLKECKQRLIYEHSEMYYSNWLTNLREKANIKIYYEKLL
ncbi:peptidylprolyl isomerase [Candidatus Pseudothioglobus singularis]|nr:peptidylprolyl isomerase [Candidatus Pseudothioglobus singularis]MDB4847318.1 peptidylprolyl isomerase [Candidatus Pseudothioglobus singularis]